MIFLQSKLKHLKVMILKKSEFKSSQSFVETSRVCGGWKFRQKCWVFFQKDANHLDFKSHNWKLSYIKPDNGPLEKKCRPETRVFYLL